MRVSGRGQHQMADRLSDGQQSHKDSGLTGTRFATRTRILSEPAGHGWNQNDWKEGFGTAAMLDRVAGLVGPADGGSTAPLWLKLRRQTEQLKVPLP